MTRTKLLSLSLVFLAIYISGCFSVKPGTSRSGGNLYETFYVGEEGTQYFIKPLAFISSDGEKELLIDFTFRYLDTLAGNVSANFSLINLMPVRTLESFRLVGKESDFVSSEVDLLFNEKIKKGFESRFKLIIPLAAFTKIVKNEEWGIELGIQSEKVSFRPSKRTQRALSKLNNNIFVLFD